MAQRHKIDDDYDKNPRTNRSKKSVIRENFMCSKCGNDKAFAKSVGFQCSRYKFMQKVKKVIVHESI